MFSRTIVIVGAIDSLRVIIELSDELIGPIRSLSSSEGWMCSTSISSIGLFLIRAMPIIASHTQIMQLILSIVGALNASGNDGSKIIPPSTYKVGSTLLGLTIAYEINPNINAPNPCPPTIIPLTIPLLLGKYSHAIRTGIK
jgi:hypothetical protein